MAMQPVASMAALLASRTDPDIEREVYIPALSKRKTPNTRLGSHDSQVSQPSQPRQGARMLEAMRRNMQRESG